MIDIYVKKNNSYEKLVVNVNTAIVLNDESKDILQDKKIGGAYTSIISIPFVKKNVELLNAMGPGTAIHEDQALSSNIGSVTYLPSTILFDCELYIDGYKTYFNKLKIHSTTTHTIKINLFSELINLSSKLKGKTLHDIDLNNSFTYGIKANEQWMLGIDRKRFYVSDDHTNREVAWYYQENVDWILPKIKETGTSQAASKLEEYYPNILGNFQTRYWNQDPIHLPCPIFWNFAIRQASFVAHLLRNIGYTVVKNEGDRTVYIASNGNSWADTQILPDTRYNNYLRGSEGSKIKAWKSEYVVRFKYDSNLEGSASDQESRWFVSLLYEPPHTFFDLLFQTVFPVIGDSSDFYLEGEISFPDSPGYPTYPYESYPKKLYVVVAKLKGDPGTKKIALPGRFEAQSDILAKYQITDKRQKVSFRVPIKDLPTWEDIGVYLCTEYTGADRRAYPTRGYTDAAYFVGSNYNFHTLEIKQGNFSNIIDMSKSFNKINQIDIIKDYLIRNMLYLELDTEKNISLKKISTDTGSPLIIEPDRIVKKDYTFNRLDKNAKQYTLTYKKFDKADKTHLDGVIDYVSPLPTSSLNTLDYEYSQINPKGAVANKNLYNYRPVYKTAWDGDNLRFEKQDRPNTLCTLEYVTLPYSGSMMQRRTGSPTSALYYTYTMGSKVTRAKPIDFNKTMQTTIKPIMDLKDKTTHVDIIIRGTIRDFLEWNWNDNVYLNERTYYVNKRAYSTSEKQIKLNLIEIKNT